MPSSINTVRTGFVAFVVDIGRTASAGNIALIDDGNAFGGDALAYSAGKDASALAVEIAFQTVSDRFVQQDARPAVAQNDGHFGGGRGPGFEVGECMRDGGNDKLPHKVFIEIRQIIPYAAARDALFAAFALFADDGNDQAHHRADDGGVFADQTGEVNDIVFAGQIGHHLHDAQIGGFGDSFHLFNSATLAAESRQAMGSDAEQIGLPRVSDGNMADTLPPAAPIARTARAERFIESMHRLSA